MSEGDAIATGRTPEETVKAAGEELVAAIAQRARDVVELAAAEARLAALSGLAMLVLVMIAAAALVVAWLLLVASALYGLWRAGMGLLWPGVAFALGHAGLAYYLWQTTARLSRNLTLPALRREVLHGRASTPEHIDVDGLVAGRS